MKAIVYTEYGSPDVLHIREVETPTPRDDEVLIKIRAVSINGSDWEGLTGKPLYARLGGLRRPSNPILGSDVAGYIERVGSNVRQFQPGEAVFGELPGYHGGFAEYAVAPEGRLVHKPDGLTFEEAATIPQAGAIALQGIRDRGQVQAGQAVLINGAGGSAGSFAVQLARLYGAEVTGVDHTGKLEFLHSLGTDHVIDYKREDFTRIGKQYDLILDIAGHRSVLATQRALKPTGRYYFTGGSTGVLFQVLLLGPWLSRTGGRSVRLLAVQFHRENLVTMAELCEAGKVVPAIDRRYSLREVPEAFRYIGQGKAKGKIVITVE